MSSDDGQISTTRRYLLQSLGTGAAAAAAGCMGGDSEPEQEEEETETTNQTETPPEDQGPDYDLPESEHMEPDEMIQEFGVLFPSELTQIKAYSPSQHAENFDKTWAGEDQIPHRSVYDIFDFEAEHVPETLNQRVQAEGTERVRADQLPNNVSREELEEAMEEAGYESAGESGDFSLYLEGDTAGARAVNDDYHLIAFASQRYSEVTSEEHMDNLSTVLDAYQNSETQLDANVAAAIDQLDVQDTIAGANQDIDNGLGLTGVGTTAIARDLLPRAGANTRNLEEGTKQTVLVFEDEEKAQGYADLVHEESSPQELGYNSVEARGRFVIGEGASEINYEDSDIYPEKPEI